MAKAKADKSDAPKCPMNAAAFQSKAKPVTIKVGDNATLIAVPKVFSTGSFGFYAGEKVIIDVDGVPMRFQVGMNLIAVGSKDAK